MKGYRQLNLEGYPDAKPPFDTVDNGDVINTMNGLYTYQNVRMENCSPVRIFMSGQGQFSKTLGEVFQMFTPVWRKIEPRKPIEFEVNTIGCPFIVRGNVSHCEIPMPIHAFGRKFRCVEILKLSFLQSRTKPCSDGVKEGAR